eukprot:scaffold239149_cov32-Tisochrysis_lutea.AAC.2
MCRGRSSAFVSASIGARGWRRLVLSESRNSHTAACPACAAWCNAVSPNSSRAPTLAPALSSTRSVAMMASGRAVSLWASAFPSVPAPTGSASALAARWSAERKLRSLASSSAPRERSSATA